VAAFGEALRGREGALDYSRILQLAQSGVGEDRQCYRHGFVEMVWNAGSLAGEDLAHPSTTCVPGEVHDDKPTVVDLFDPPEVDAPQFVQAAEQDWGDYLLEVLRLLPPLLAFPFFVMAWGKPRRRRGRGGATR
jgi:hypothetical protein